MIALEPGRSALLVMDFQSEIVGMFGDKLTPLVERTAALVATARKAQLPIVYVVVAFRPGHPELSPRHPSYERIAKTNRLVAGSSGAEIVAALRPADGDAIVTKSRVNAFAGTDLEVLLRARGIDTLLLCGIATSGVVLSTVRHAADADYRLVVVRDCCADADEEVHRVLTEKILPRQATVTTADELTAALG
jgi:nicotinamidase-related amidase